MREPYSSQKKKKKHFYKEERDDMRRYLRDSLKYQEYSLYCLLFLAVLAAVLFIRQLFS
jgi:hypothetical protein